MVDVVLNGLHEKVMICYIIMLYFQKYIIML